MNFVFFVVKKIAFKGRTPTWHRNDPQPTWTHSKNEMSFAMVSAPLIEAFR